MEATPKINSSINVKTRAVILFFNILSSVTSARLQPIAGIEGFAPLAYFEIDGISALIAGVCYDLGSSHRVSNLLGKARHMGIQGVDTCCHDQQ